jgi:uncharacterized membrane protein YhaH (DUF805 family)
VGLGVTPARLNVEKGLSMSFMEAIKSVLSKYAVFSGRARRSEYWWFVLANGIVSNILYFVTIGPAYQKALNDSDFSNFSFGVGGMVYSLYALAIFLPSLAVMVRRLHDTGRSGWYYWMVLIPFAGIFIVLYYLIQEGTNGANAYGADPKA